MSKAVKPDTMPQNSIEEVSLDDLVENDYNPRKTFSDAKMDQLIDSIEKVGLIEPLVVRQLDSGKYEVIAGSRRFHALQEADYDSTIPVNVLDADDDQAKLIALSENLEREDLSPIEEAYAYAEYVDVTLPRSEAESLDGVEMVGVTDSKGETRYRVNFSDYVEYIKGGTISAGPIAKRAPAAGSGAVKTAADTIPGATPTRIEHKLKLLWLPEELQVDIDNGELTEKVGEALATLRQIDEVDRMHDEMRNLGKDDKFRGSGADTSQLRSKVQRVLDEYETEDEQKADAVESRLNAAAKHLETLGGHLEDVETDSDLVSVGMVQKRCKTNGEDAQTALNELGEPATNASFVEVDDDEENDYAFKFAGGFDPTDLPDLTALVNGPVPAVQLAESVVSATEKLRDALSTGYEDEISDKAREIEAEAKTLKETANRMKQESRDTCPYCHSRCAATTLDDEADRLKSEAEAYKDEMQAVQKRRSSLAEIRSDVRRAKKDFESEAVDLLEKEIGDQTSVTVVRSDDGELKSRLHPAVDVSDLDMSKSTASDLLENVQWVAENSEIEIGQEGE